MKISRALISTIAISAPLLAACGASSEHPRADEASSNGSAAANATDHAGWIHVPGGQLVHPSCVHALAKGAQITESRDIVLGGEVVAHHPDCAFQPLDTKAIGRGKSPEVLGTGTVAADLIGGLLEYSSYTSPAPASILGWIPSTGVNTGTWTVPAAPTANHGQTVFLAQGAMGAEWIITTALQWGSSTHLAAVQAPVDPGTGLASPWGGQYWQIAAWATDLVTGNIYMGTPAAVNVGDVLESQAYWTGFAFGNSPPHGSAAILDTSRSNSFGYLRSDVSFVNHVQLQTAFAGLLEVYGVTACSDLPATSYTVFSPPALWESTSSSPVGVSWTANLNVAANALGSGCSFSAAITSGSGTSLTY